MITGIDEMAAGAAGSATLIIALIIFAIFWWHIWIILLSGAGLFLASILLFIKWCIT